MCYENDDFFLMLEEEENQEEYAKNEEYQNFLSWFFSDSPYGKDKKESEESEEELEEDDNVIDYENNECLWEEHLKAMMEMPEPAEACYKEVPILWEFQSD